MKYYCLSAFPLCSIECLLYIQHKLISIPRGSSSQSAHGLRVVPILLLCFCTLLLEAVSSLFTYFVNIKVFCTLILFPFNFTRHFEILRQILLVIHPNRPPLWKHIRTDKLRNGNWTTSRNQLSTYSYPDMPSRSSTLALTPQESIKHKNHHHHHHHDRSHRRERMVQPTQSM